MTTSPFFHTPRAPQALEQDYNTGRFVASLPAIIAGWGARSAAVEARHVAVLRRRLPYGPHPREVLDYYATGPRGAPLLVFIHGGFWKAVSVAESGLIVGHWPARGVHVAVLDYALAPEVTLSTIVAQVRQGLRWLLAHAEAFGFDPARVVVVGHSAGAHLAAMAWLRDSAALPLAGLALLSGLFELEPVRQSPVNAVVGMSEAEAAALSPARYRPAPLPLLVAVGEHESTAFHEHSRLLAWNWRDAGCPTRHMLLPGHNHFSLLDDAAEPDSALGGAIATLLGI